MTSTGIINKTLDFADLSSPEIRPTVVALRRWVWGWLVRGERLAVNGHARRRAYIRRHKMWEYARGLALTGASAPARRSSGPLRILDVGGALSAPVLYQSTLGDQVVCLDLDEMLVADTRRVARRRGLAIDARRTNLGREDRTAAQLGAEGGFDRVYCFCVIEHVPPAEQPAIARRMASLLKPGGQLCLTFDYGEQAPSEAPLRSAGQVEALRQAVGLPLMANDSFVDTGKRYPLNRRWPDQRYTFGSLFFCRPDTPEPIDGTAS